MTNQLTPRGVTVPTPDSALAAVRSWPSKAAWEWTRDAVAAARRDMAVDAIVATGSAIRDVERTDDLDLVLVYRERRPTLSRPPMDVDVRQYERADVPRLLKSGHDYLAWTVRFGRPLFERDGTWAALRADWIDRVATPSADEARVRAQKMQRLRDDMLAVGDHDAAADLEISMLTHLARAALSEAGVFPLSRPELPGQLRDIGDHALADRLDQALRHRP
ncbi:MAG: hypothetical protein OXC56_02680 [Chloroflexi bacterium]|nr:hypothetical protein [Chloroflexota bacterium]